MPRHPFRTPRRRVCPGKPSRPSRRTRSPVRPVHPGTGPHGGGELMAGRVALSRWTRLCLVVAAVVVAFATVLSTRLGGPRTAQMVSDFGLCYAAITAAVACVLRGHQFTGRPRWGWSFIGFGLL